jgi:hypothetical protein
MQTAGIDVAERNDVVCAGQCLAAVYIAVAIRIEKERAVRHRRHVDGDVIGARQSLEGEIGRCEDIVGIFKTGHHRRNRAERRASLCLSGSEEMQKRVDAGCGDIRICFQIGVGVERGRRIAAFLPPSRQIVLVGIDPGRGNIRIVREIIADIEKGVRIAPLMRTELRVVLRGIDPGIPHVAIRRVVVKIIDAGVAVVFFDGSVFESEPLKVREGVVSFRTVDRHRAA